MNKCLIGLVLFFCIIIVGCSTAPDYQALAGCTVPDTFHSEPKDGESYGLFVGKPYNLSGFYEKWFPVITHVDCVRVAEIWSEKRLSPGMHRIRLRLNPEALGNDSGNGYGGGLLGAGMSQKHTDDGDRSAQSFDFTVEAGKEYFGYSKVLTFGDMSFWVVDEEDNIVLQSQNFEAKWQEKVLKNNAKLKEK